MTKHYFAAHAGVSIEPRSKCTKKQMHARMERINRDRDLCSRIERYIARQLKEYDVEVKFFDIHPSSIIQFDD